mmetsp:Transcript_42897/g.99938  ORF Transcript_42897/g.99938 Transcript_42897/m.99938 type:complete len:242 (+) Transcript_42897:37-762(+)
MDDPFAVLRIPGFTVRKESDLPKLKERAMGLVKQYEKVNKFDKAREVEKAYRSVKEMVLKRASCAGAQAFSKIMVNKPSKRSSSGAPKPVEKPAEKAKAKNPAEAHFLKAQGSTSAPAEPAEPRKSREERLREKVEARRAAKGTKEAESEKRAAAIREKLAAKRAKQGDGLSAGGASPPESLPSISNMGSPESGAEAEGAEPEDKEALEETPEEHGQEKEDDEAQGEGDTEEALPADVDYF